MTSHYSRPAVARALLFTYRACVCCFLPAAAFADSQAASGEDGLQQVIVTATRASGGVPSSLLGSSVTVIDPVDMERRQVRVVSDVLRDVPGVAVNRSGSVGGTTQVRVRGTEGNHVLVLIDGMEVADPYFGEFDFATLIADEVSRIEVLRGQQSALYGSDAIGGVIHYITLSGREAPGLSGRIESGSFDSWDGAIRYGGNTGRLDYALSGGYQTTEGVPTARFGMRDVGADNAVASARLEFDATETLRLKAIARYSRTNAESNDQDFGSPFGVFPYGYAVDSDDRAESRAFYGLLRGELSSLESRWINAITLQGADARREGYSDGMRISGDEGSRLKASYESTFRFGPAAWGQSITAAFDFERERMQNTSPFLNEPQALEREVENKGYVVQYEASIDDRIGLGAAYRFDDNGLFDSADTYRVQGSYRFDSGTRLRAAAGSGIKSPTVTELFGFDPETFIGNPDLKPERSEGWEVGFEQTFAREQALVGVTYFDSTLHDEIFTVFTGPNFVASPENRATESTQDGFELYAMARLGESWRIDAAYTDLDAAENGVEEVRRPAHIASLSVDWRAPSDRAGLNLTVRYNGEMLDNNFTGVGPSLVKMPDYTLVTLGGDYRLTERARLYARVENLLDEDYEEVYTFRSAGRAGYVGVRVNF